MTHFDNLEYRAGECSGIYATCLGAQDIRNNRKILAPFVAQDNVDALVEDTLCVKMLSECANGTCVGMMLRTDPEGLYDIVRKAYETPDEEE